MKELLLRWWFALASLSVDTLTNIQAWYKMDSTSDSSGNNFTITNVGCTLTTGVDGGSNSAYIAAANTNYMGRDTVAVIPLNSDSTISCWVKGTHSTNGIIVLMVGSSGGNIGLTTAGGKLTVCYGTSVYTAAGNISINDNNWHHIAMVSDRATPANRIFVDGVFITTVALGVNPSIPINWLGLFNYRLGYHPTNENYVGAIDNVRIYKDAKQDTFIKYLFDNKL